MRRALLPALLAAVLQASPTTAQVAANRIGDWTISRIGDAQGGAVCSALRTYGGGYAMEVMQARGLPGQLILRLESPKITYRPGQKGEDVPGPDGTPYGLVIVINDIAGSEGPDAIVRQGPRGLGFVTVLKESDDPKFSPIRNLRIGRSVYAYVGGIEGEVVSIGRYNLAGSGAALDALARCVDGEAAAAPRPVTPVVPPPTPPAPGGVRPGTASVLPVPFGKYAVNQSCADAAAANDYLGLSRTYWSEIDGDTPIGPFRNVDGNRWALGHGSGLTITVTGPKTFSENGRSMTWCKP